MEAGTEAGGFFETSAAEGLDGLGDFVLEEEPTFDLPPPQYDDDLGEHWYAAEDDDG